MKSELQQIILNDLCEQIIDSEHKTAPTQSSGIPYVRTPNVKDTRLILDDSLRVTEETYKEWTKRIEPKPYDIILCREAPVGDSAMILPNQKLCLGQRTVLIRANKEKIYPKYLVFFLNSPKIKHELLSNSGGTHVDHLNMKDIRNLKMQILHSYDEQKIIGDFLFNLNSQIYSKENQNKILEQIAQTIFKSWFINFDGVTEFEDSDLGKIPKGWKISTIGKEFRTILGGTPSRKKEEYWKNGTISWINSGAVNDFPILKETEKITIEGLKKSATKLMPKKTVVLPFVVSLGKEIKTSMLGIESCGNQSVLGILENKNICAEYIYYCVQFMKNNIYSSLTGGAQQHINKGNVDDTKIFLPEQKLLEQFKKIAQPIFDKIINNRKEIFSHEKIRDVLLPKLMSRDIRV